MRILIAPNAFKNSLHAIDVASAIEQGLKQSCLTCTTKQFPIADGGDGTGSLLVETCGGVHVSKQVHDPLGRNITASFGLIDGGRTAAIEMADASGLRLLTKDELNPLLTSSYGTGELIKFALNEGVTKIILAMGGSATVDAGCGILSALGIKFLDATGQSLAPTPAALSKMMSIDVSGLDKRMLNCEIVILCDVNNKLLGPDGAARVFGPQKGATPQQVILLEDFLTLFAEISAKESGIHVSEIRHGGTAGGAAAGLHAFINAKLVNGIDYFLSLTNFDKALQESDIVITGEGSIDTQTLQGKGPYGVARAAKKKHIPVVGIAGNVPLEKDDELQKYFDVLININKEATDIQTAIKNTAQNLVKAAKTIGDLLAAGKLL